MPLTCNILPMKKWNKLSLFSSGSFLPKAVVASMLAFTMSSNPSFAQSQQDSITTAAIETLKWVEKGSDVESGKINSLETTMKDLRKEEIEQTRLLRKAWLWTKPIKDALPPLPKSCWLKPNVIEFQQRKEYKECLIEAIPVMKYRVNSMKALLEKPEENLNVSTDTNSTLLADTSGIFDADDLNILAQGDTTVASTVDSISSPISKNTATSSSNNIKSTTDSHTINILAVIDLNDTTSINKAQVSEAEKLLAKYGNVAVYGADIKGSLDSNSTVEVLQVENVKSREKTGASTQYIIRVIDNTTGKEKQIIVSNENPIDKLTAAIKGESGCYCFSVKQWDDDGKGVDPSLMD